LTREAHLAKEITVPQHFQLRLGHLLGLAYEVFYPAGGASSVRAAAVQDVYSGVLLYRQDQPLALRNVEISHTFYF